jgi:hypothetical protein
MDRFVSDYRPLLLDWKTRNPSRAVTRSVGIHHRSANLYYFYLHHLLLLRQLPGLVASPRFQVS